MRGALGVVCLNVMCYNDGCEPQHQSVQASGVKVVPIFREDFGKISTHKTTGGQPAHAVAMLSVHLTKSAGSAGGHGVVGLAVSRSPMNRFACKRFGRRLDCKFLGAGAEFLSKRCACMQLQVCLSIEL